MKFTFQKKDEPNFFVYSSLGMYSSGIIFFIKVKRYMVIKKFVLLVFDRGSRGPSTVTFIALVYVATCGGVVDTVIVMLKLLPKQKNTVKLLILTC